MRFYHEFKALALVALSLTMFAGCTASARLNMMVDNMKPFMDAAEKSVRRSTDVSIVRQAMPSSIIQMEGLLEASPDNRELIAKLSETYNGYAFMFVEDENRAHALKLYAKGKKYGLRALMFNQDFKNAYLDEDLGLVSGLRYLTKDDVRALYFTTINWLGWLGMYEGERTDVILDIPKIEKMMDRLLELDDTFQHGAAHALLATYFASTPIMFGGSPEDAKYQFDEAFGISKSKYLLWYFLYARYYAIQIKDRQLFEDTLNRIIQAPDNLYPECNLDNQIAKMKARKLLSQIDEYFNPSE